MDRAWRQHPDQSAMWAPLYGRLLALEGTDWNAALTLLRFAADEAPDPDVAALIVHALLQMRREQEACGQFERALADYCIDAGGLLARVGADILERPELALPGWLGRGPGLELIGQLSASEPNSLEVGIDGGSTFTQMLPHMGREGVRSFTFPQPQAGARVRLVVSSRGAPLLGSAANPPADFGLDGRVDSRGRRLTGWARLGWYPGRVPTLRVEDETGRSVSARVGDVAEPGWRWRFAADLRAAKFSGSRIVVSARLPDGLWHPLPGAPLLLEAPLHRGSTSPTLGTWRNTPVARKSSRALKQAKTVDIIIPVHRGREEVLACIDSVFGSIGPDARLLVIDDASDDPALGLALEELEAEGRIQLLRNAENRGFVASVNRGLTLHPTRDVVILNSDTLVFGDWLTRLRAAAYSAAHVGTVTPFSNSGSIASFPCRDGSAMNAATAAELHTLAADTLAETRIEIPVGVGFCLYMRRDCLREVGELDAGVFGKGYGEEADFCLRARGLGWTHLLAADVFVYHAGGVSFGGRRRALLERSQRLLNLRYPGYDRFIQSFLAQDPLAAARRRLDERRLVAFDGRLVLLVTLALSGGVERFVTERSRQLRAQGLYPLILRPTKAGNREHCELWTDALEVPNLTFEVPRDLPPLSALLGKLNLHGVEIQHFMDLDARIIDVVRGLAVPYEVVVHDYSWICPRITLIDGTNRYCGEPDVSVCQECVRRHGSKLGERISVSALRERSAQWLKGASRVLAPSADTAARLQRYFGDVEFTVRPHTRPEVSAFRQPRPADRTALRIALIGAIGTHKGYKVLLECARDARTRKLPIEFVVIGYTENDATLTATGKVFITGEYSEPEVSHLIQRERPDIAWLPSVWPETWCYTLDHGLNAGLPVAAFDVGAIAERLRDQSDADLMPLGLAAPRINDRLIEFANRASATNLTVERPIEKNSARLVSGTRDDDSMLENTTEGMFMSKAFNGTPSAQLKDEGLSASVQVLSLPGGLYIFSVKAGSAPPVSNLGQLALPAMHIGLGPGASPDQVEFLAGPTTHGAWLFKPGDLLVTRVTGTAVTLVLTSVRAPAGEVLSIKVERLEDRVDDPIVPLQAPAAAVPANGASKSPPKPAAPLFASTSDLPLPVQIGAHIRTRGDMSFSNVPWAGRIAPGLWIESFAVLPTAHFAASDIEYKGLTGSGFETPWITDNGMCGTKGMATPLVGFAIRLKPSPDAATYDCEYSGYFQSGTTVGPLRNGAPCRSSVANDSLEGIQVRIVKRAATSLPEAKRHGVAAAASPPPLQANNGPSVAAPAAETPAARAKGKGRVKAPTPSVRAKAADGKKHPVSKSVSNRTARPALRQPARRP